MENAEPHEQSLFQRNSQCVASHGLQLHSKKDHTAFRGARHIKELELRGKRGGWEI